MNTRLLERCSKTAFPPITFGLVSVILLIVATIAVKSIYTTISQYSEYAYASEFDSQQAKILGVQTPQPEIPAAQLQIEASPFPADRVKITIKDSSEDYLVNSARVSDIFEELSQELNLGTYYHDLEEFGAGQKITQKPASSSQIPRIENYTTSPKIDSILKYPFEIKIIELTQDVKTKEYKLDYDTQIIKDDNLELGKEEVVQEGEPGIVTEIVKNLYEDEELVKTVVLDKTVAKQPITEIVEVGTKVAVPSDVNSCDYWDGIIDSKTSDSEERDWLKAVMRCESRCNAKADSGTYKGLFQFHPNTFERNSSEGMDIWNGGDQLDVTIEMIRNGRKSAWGCSR
ncbi:hypothetical protein GF357_02400 [Candidatus Dojkabacteria bacterium]|nr:hypothetical protein [Candidatus Dojkabacteria bacterium]